MTQIEPFCSQPSIYKLLTLLLEILKV